MSDDAMNAAREARLKAAADALPREVEPAHDLWPGIRARIDAGRIAVVRVRRSIRIDEQELERYRRDNTCRRGETEATYRLF